MRTESWLFAGTALFFFVTGAVYGWFSHDPAGSSALAVSFLMSALIAFFFQVQRRRHGRRPEDRADSSVADGAAQRARFFPPRSGWPPVTAAGFALVCLGVPVGLWLLLIGVGVLLAGVLGFVFQYAPTGDAGERR